MPSHPTGNYPQTLLPKAFHMISQSNLGMCSSKDGSKTAEMCSFSSICGTVIDRKRQERGKVERREPFYYCHRCRIAHQSLSLHSESVIGAIQHRDFEIWGHLDGSRVCHGISTVHSESLLGVFKVAQRIYSGVTRTIHQVAQLVLFLCVSYFGTKDRGKINQQYSISGFYKQVSKSNFINNTCNFTFCFLLCTSFS